MALELTVPSPGESITEVTLGAWHKADGEWVDKDELLVEIESDKATLELRAPQAGKLAVRAATGDELKIGAVVGELDTAAKPPAGGARDSAGSASQAGASQRDTPSERGAAAPPADAGDGDGAERDGPKATSVARKLAADRGVDLGRVRGTGPGGRITKDDVIGAADTPSSASAPLPSSSPEAAGGARIAPTGAAPAPGARTTRRERMTKLRQRIAERLVEAQRTAAMLTTFNECDMTEVMRLRNAHKEQFEKTHGVGLGFMGFFVTACVSALRKYPRVNAFIVDGEKGPEIEHHDFVDIAVAVSTDKGLVVPVVRNAETLSFAAIERGIRDLATRARDGSLSVDELTGGTFTITNGGVYGSLMSTPILNPPQSGILGMHAIRNRPVEHPDRPGEIALRPMMYLALSYDHRLVDGAEAVGFLVHVKQCIEHPERMLLGL